MSRLTMALAVVLAVAGCSGDGIVELEGLGPDGGAVTETADANGAATDAGQGGDAGAVEADAGTPIVDAGSENPREDAGVLATVSFVAPQPGETVANPVTFRASASGGVASVRYSADGWPLGSSGEAGAQYAVTYTFSTTGPRTVLAEGLDGSGASVASATLAFIIETPSACELAGTPSLSAPSVCDGPSGRTSTELSPSGFYSTSWFGCYRKSDGSIYQDPYDNCEFACGSRGLCDSSLSGPQCEAELQWFAADADRYGCGGRIRVTNCANGRSVVLATLDRGPNCVSVERECGAATIDMSHPAMVYLFEGRTYGSCEHKAVLVEQVDSGTPLGP